MPVCYEQHRYFGFACQLVSNWSDWRRTEFATRSLFSSWAQLRKFSSAFTWTFAKPFTPFLWRRLWDDRAKVTARLGWTENEKQHLEAVLQGRHETALVGMAPDVAAMLANWHQTNWFTVQVAEKRALHATGNNSVHVAPGGAENTRWDTHF